MIRVRLPHHLRTLAGVDGEIRVAVAGVPTTGELIDALEAAYPPLRGTVRDPATHQRRPFVRFFACEEDISHRPADDPLPPEVVSGREPFHIIGAMAGG